MKIVRTPKNKDGLIIDIYYDQFAEKDDYPNITIHVDNNEYDESSSKELREHAEWMLKVANWLDYKNRRK